ncbi:MAG: 6-phosphofructokinase [Patescibacteria group bacterium]
MSANKTILVFTGGGLAPALNPTLYGVISAAKKNNYRILGGLFGWQCLSEEGNILDLTDYNIESLKSVGGTFLRSSRTNPFHEEGKIDSLKKKLKEHSIDVVVAIGGDDTLGAAKNLFVNEGIATIGIPKTIDNDLMGTYFTPGFPSAAYYLYSFAEQIKIDAAYALSRIYIVESLGQKVGWLTAASVYGQPDVILPPEKKYDLDKVLTAIKDRYRENGNFATVVVSEEANFSNGLEGQADDQKESFGHQRKNFIALELRKVIKQRLNIDCKAVFPGNWLQAGPPIEIDRDFGIKLGHHAIELIKSGSFGSMPCIKRKEDSKELYVGSVLLTEVTYENQRKCLTGELFDFDEFKPRQSYLDYLEPILGKYNQPDSDYWRLISSINKR